MQNEGYSQWQYVATSDEQNLLTRNIFAMQHILQNNSFFLHFSQLCGIRCARAVHTLTERALKC